jgi:AcrR family transcriptional regulator
MENSHSRRTPKQSRSQERYELIVEEAAKLFFERGFDGATTNEIARRADISIGSLYQYFNNKEAIVEALADRYVAGFREVATDVVKADVSQLSTEEAVDRLLNPILKFHLSYPEFRTLWLATEVTPELREAMRAIDNELVHHVSSLLEARVPRIPRRKAKLVMAVLDVGVKSLVTMLGRTDDLGQKARVATEVKRMLALYIDDVIRQQK